jgi:hypothetical protein
VDPNLREMREKKDAKIVQWWKIEAHVGVSDAIKKRRK